MGKANFFFKNGKWQLLGQHGNKIWEVDNSAKTIQEGGDVFKGTGSMYALDVASLADVQSVKIGGEDTISWLYTVSGTSPAVTSIGTAGVTTVTLTGVASAGITSGDKVFANPKQALAGHVGFVGAHIPTTNVVNLYLANTKPDSAGSAPAIGWDIIAMRAA